MQKLRYIVFYFLSFSLHLSAQQSWGFINSNYAGVSTVDLNPSAMVFSNLGWDINVLSADVSVLNNSFYNSPKFALPLLFKQQINIGVANTSNVSKLTNDDFIIHANIQTNTFLNLAVNIKGPSVMFTNGNSAFAFTTGFREGTSITGTPKNLTRLAYENLVYGDLYNQSLSVPNGTNIAVMVWSEIGISYAHKLTDDYFSLFSGGISLKFLSGYAGGYAISRGIDYTVPYASNFTGTNLNLDYGHAVHNENNPVMLSNPIGSGISTDLGITYIRKKKPKKGPYYPCPDPTGMSASYVPPRNYKWKLGASLLDVGSISFKTDAVAYSYSSAAFSWDNATNVIPKTLKGIDSLIAIHFVSTNTSSPKNFFQIWLPTALSMQFDYNYNDVIYFNTSFVQRLVLTSDAHLNRMNSIAITPRYETYNFEVAMPIILNEYVYPNLGLMIRYRYFFIGTDQLGSTLGFTDLYGLNVYAGIKISHFGYTRKDPKMVY